MKKLLSITLGSGLLFCTGSLALADDHKKDERKAEKKDDHKKDDHKTARRTTTKRRTIAQPQGKRHLASAGGHRSAGRLYFQSTNPPSTRMFSPVI